MKTTSPPRKTRLIPHKTEAAGGPEHWDLRLYVAGPSPKSVVAFRNLHDLCELHLAGRYHIEVIDLTRNPQLAQIDQILAVPTLVRKMPAPIRKIIGTLSNSEKVVIGLDLRPQDANPAMAAKGGSNAE